MKKLILITFLILIKISAFAQTINTNSSFEDSLANNLLQNSELKTLAIGIVKNGKTTIHYYGKENMPNGNSLFEIASLTKTFTGLLLAQAIIDKKVKLDTDVRKYLKGIYHNLSFDNKPITIGHLATHYSGLPYTFPNKPEIFVNPDYDNLPFVIDSLERNFTKKDFFDALGKVKLDTLPGTRFQYSNVGANLIAYILEDIYSMKYEKLLEKYIFKKANMKSTKLALDKNETVNLMQGYNPKGIKMPFYSESIRAAGALKSTLPDMMKYVLFQLNESNKIVDLSHQAIWKEENGNYASSYFWQMINTPNDKKLFQNGGSFGTSSWLELYPQRKLGIFLITNRSGPNTHNLLSNAADKIQKKTK